MLTVCHIALRPAITTACRAALACYNQIHSSLMPLKPFAPNSGAEKKIFLLKPRGFCAGVVRAIDVVKIALDLYGPPVYVRKEIVHNKHVVDELREAGAIFVEELDEVPAGARAIFSAHGVAPAVRRQAKERQPGRDRRHLPAGHQGAPGSGAVRARRLQHRADRPQGPRRSDRHAGRGAASAATWWKPWRMWTAWNCPIPPACAI